MTRLGTIANWCYPDAMKIELNADEALVLFEWIMRFSDRGTYPVEHEAEELVLWQIEAQLETTLVEPFEPNYVQLVEQARARIVADQRAR